VRPRKAPGMMVLIKLFLRSLRKRQIPKHLSRSTYMLCLNKFPMHYTNSNLFSFLSMLPMFAFNS